MHGGCQIQLVLESEDSSVPGPSHAMLFLRFSEQMFIRLRSICDAHMRLKVEEVGDQLVKALEVAKIRGAEKSTGNVISFEVEPNLGMRIVPITKAKA